MQDISKLPDIDLDAYLVALKDKPLDERIFKYKIDRLFSISMHNESQYMGDVQDVYAWLLLCNRRLSFKDLMPNDKLQKYFCSEFLMMCAKHLIICKKFHLNQMMLLTEQYLAECLVFFNNNFGQLDRFPGLASLPATVLRIDRHFYKQNAISDYVHLIVQPTKEEIHQNFKFVENLKEGDLVDALKTEMFGRRMCWSRAKVYKITAMSVSVEYLNDKADTNRSIQKTAFQIVPPMTFTKDDFDWRLQLKAGDFVDYECSDGWVSAQIQSIKTITVQDRLIYQLKFKKIYENELYSNCAYSTSPKVQKSGLILSQEFETQNIIYQDINIDDFNDLILDQQNKGQHIVLRADVMKSQLYIDLGNMFDKIGALDRILTATQEKKIGVEVCSELASFIETLQLVFHRSFGLKYLTSYSLALMNYIKELDENNIRNLSKERYKNFTESLAAFLPKLMSPDKKRILLDELQLQLGLRFIDSDFLERKMQATTIFTDLLKMSNSHSSHLKPSDLFKWFNQNGIIKKIFNEKSHNQLISRGTDFLKLYLLEETNSIKVIAPLLEYSEPLLKLNNQLYEYFPNDYKEQLVEKISAKKGVSNKDALEIMKKHGGNELWFLENGGQGWVEVIRLKKKRADDINAVFVQPFNVILRITEEISKCFDGRLRNEYFDNLYTSNYGLKVFSLDVPLTQKVKFLKMMLDNLLYLVQDIFQQFLLLWQQHSQCNLPEFYVIFQHVVTKLELEQTKTFFSRFFEDEQSLKNLTNGGFQIFKLTFIKINQFANNIQKQYEEYYSDSYPPKKERKETLTITVNPIELVGMENLMTVVFESKSSSVIEYALNFISFLFNHLAPALAQSLVQFKDNFLQQCLEKLYNSQNPSKYLQIVRSILDESEHSGNGNLPSLEAALPGQKHKLTVIDCFTLNKRKFQVEVLSNITVYQLRFLLSKQVGAFPYEISLSIDKKPIENMLNGYTIRQANLAEPITIQRKVKIERANLTDYRGKFTPEAKQIFGKLFRMYSTDGLMSKQDCQRYHQKCVGDNTSGNCEKKVENIYETYDGDKDGNLDVEEFIRFYESACKSKESAVWSNLQVFGIRPDLKILDDEKIVHADPTTLIRHLLVNDEKFMSLLFKTLESDSEEDKTAAWGLLERLPLRIDTKFEFDLTNPRQLKYWLYLVDARGQQKLITRQILERICDSDAETLAVGLKSAIQVQGMDLPIFQRLIGKLTQINKQHFLSVFDQLSLDYALALIVKCLNKEVSVQNEFIQNKEKYETLLLSGLLSANSDVRERYQAAIWCVLQFSCQDSFPIFKIMFTFLYRHFQTSTKSGLHPEFFHLFSKTLELVKEKPSVLAALDLDWKTLTRSLIQRFKTHKCTEERLSSTPDWVAQGFMSILSRLLDETTAIDLETLVPYLFQTLLFPEGGTNKLKTATTRKEAYQLIYTICKYNPDSLEELFKNGFRKVYKSVANTKSQAVSSYFFNYYNQVRSDCGYAGVRNLGCICYMIAMIQQFYMTRPLRYLLLMADDQEPECLVKRGTKQIDDNVLHQFQTMFANLQLTERQEFNPDEFCFALKDQEGNSVNVSIQQDAQQFLNMLFQRLEKGLSRTPFKHILQSTYGGTNINQLTCSGCQNVKESNEHFYNISLEIKGFKNYDQSFKKFIEGEVISDYMCDFCKQKCDTTKRTILGSLPNYLIIHLQRICFNYDRFENEKINSRWEFPDQLNVYDYTSDKEKNKPKTQNYEYRLKGIVVHVGSAEYGHYFSYIKTTETQWFEFNDERVRQFDPDDIENECFGGEYWRRENQSAYLLVYEKKIKNQIRLQFESKEQMEQMLKSLELPATEIVDKPEEDIEQPQEKEDQVENKKSGQPKKPVFAASIDIEKIPYYVPQKLVERINKSNQEFSMSLNVSNNEFAHFIYRILSIQPPASLKTEFLELCHQCFHFKQQREGDFNISDWMVNRFKELIVGSGWDFYDQAVMLWPKDIFSQEKTTRVSAKNVLVAVLTDIITPEIIAEAENEISSQSQQSETEPQSTPLDQVESTACAPQSRDIKKQPRHLKIINFLDKTLNMLENQVAKSWQKYDQYFQFWYQLLKSNKILLKYAKNRNMMEKLLDFILQSQSPFRTATRDNNTMNRFNHSSYEFPLEVVGLLIEEGYEMGPLEQKCLGHVAFLEKLIRNHPVNCNLVEVSCKNQPVNTQRFVYLLLMTTSKVGHSDDMKPIMAATERFLAIDDDMVACRIEWLMGYPQLVYHPKTDSFGMYGISDPSDQVVQFKSGLRLESYLQILQNVREKLEHITSLFVTMLMQLQRKGYFNLCDYPSPLLLNKDYSVWIPSFSKTYFQDTRRMMGVNYIHYGDRVLQLSNEREVKPSTNPLFLVGKTISNSETQRKVIGCIQVTSNTYVVPLIPFDEANKNEIVPLELISKRTKAFNINHEIIKKYPGVERFVCKVSSLMSNNYFDKDDNDESSLLDSANNQFSSPIQTDYIRKITFKNLSGQTQIIVVRFEKADNVQLPLCPISFELHPKSEDIFVAHKVFPDQPMGEIKYTLQVFEKETSNQTYASKSTVSQLITPVKDDITIDVNSDQDNGFSY